MSTTTPPPDEREGLRFSPWNLLLLLPFLMLVTPWFNFTDPRLFGMPFFYWVQFGWVVASGEGYDADELDEGTRR